MSFRKIFIAFALLGVFMFAFLNFGLDIARNNDVNQSILSDTQMNDSFNRLQANLSSYSAVSQGQRENFESELPTEGFGTLIIFAIISAGKVFTSLLVGIFNTIFFPLSNIIGVSPVILGVFASIFLLTIIFAAWRVYKSGE